MAALLIDGNLIPTILKFKNEFIQVVIAVFVIQILGILTPVITIGQYIVAVTQLITIVPEDINVISRLTGSVEIKTGTRSVMSYFLEPITQGLGNSMKEK